MALVESQATFQVNPRVGKRKGGLRKNLFELKNSFNARHTTTLDSEISRHKIYDYQRKDFKGFTVDLVCPK